MELVYEKNNQATTIIYGATFASWLQQISFKEKHIFLITNQRYYDLFSDKLIQLLDDQQELDWYICKNDSHCNNFSELEGILSFLAKFNHHQEFLFLGIGNEGVVQLAAFLQKTSMFRSECLLLPLSIRAFSKSMITEAQIELNNQAALKCSTLANQIIFDHTLASDRGDGKLADFLIFIRCGLLCSHEFLRMLYRNYNSNQKLRQQSFNGMLEQLITYYKADGEEIDQFGRVFEQAFFQTTNGHLLSDQMKKLLGSLLQLLWSQQVHHFDFHYKNFLVWLIHLGFPIDFPEQLLLSEYVEGVLYFIKRGEVPACLKEIGIAEKNIIPKVDELIKTVEEYKTILEEIRGQ